DGREASHLRRRQRGRDDRGRGHGGGRRSYECPANAAGGSAFCFRAARESLGDDPVHGGDSAPVANLLYSVFKNASRAARSPGGSAPKRSRAFAASPPCISTACSAVLARPSC